MFGNSAKTCGQSYKQFVSIDIKVGNFDKAKGLLCMPL